MEVLFIENKVCNMPKAISYIRFSSSTQKQGDSENRQTTLVNSWLEQNPSVKLSNLQYKDLGRSGFHGDHLDHGFGQLLSAIDNGAIASGDYILVEAIDRIGRLPVMQALNILTGICIKGVKIITLEDGNEYSGKSISENAGIIYYLIGKIDMAHNYSKNLSRRISSSWNNKRKLAESGGGVNRKSFWYITQDENGKYNTITPQDKSLVNKIFTMFLSGVSLNKIVLFMKEHDSVRFGKQSAVGLKKMLLNKTAIGWWGETDNAYPAVIDEQLFYAVQNKINTTPVGKQSPKSNHIMAGLVVCGTCGKNYAIRNQKHSATVMYCSNAGRNNCTNTTVMPLAILNEFRSLTQLPYIRKILDSKVDDGNQKLIIEIDGKIPTLQTSIDNLVSMAESGIRSAVERSIELQNELDSLILQRAGLNATTSTSIDLGMLRESGLDMAKDPLILNGLLRSNGYKIIAEGKSISNADEKMTYIGYVKTGAQTGGYKMDVWDQKEHLIIPKVIDTDNSRDEQAYALITEGK